MIRETREAGVEVLVGDGSRDGVYVQPRIVRVLGVKPGMRAWDRESFGPGECSHAVTYEIILIIFQKRQNIFFLLKYIQSL